MFHLLYLSAVLAASSPVDIAGDHKAHPESNGTAIDYRLTADARFDWQLARGTGDINLNGHTFTMNTGGGNVTQFVGTTSGHGHLLWQGGGNDVWQTRPSFLKSDVAVVFIGINDVWWRETTP